MTVSRCKVLLGGARNDDTISLISGIYEKVRSRNLSFLHIILWKPDFSGKRQRITQRIRMQLQLMNVPGFFKTAEAGPCKDPL